MGASEMKWSLERAKAWAAEQPWRVGCNFLPSSAVNQLEMFRAETWDPETIDRELGWAEGLGFNSLRVYLHDLCWLHDREGFVRRLDEFLSIASSHGMDVLLTLFDDCHRPDPVWGAQPLPVSGVHNSEWKHSPGQEVVLRFAEGREEASEAKRLQDYVQGVLDRFGRDPRVFLWDLYNEPGRSENGDRSLPLLKKTWEWAREVPIDQPLTSCVDGSVGDQVLAFNLGASDIISFHCYIGSHLEPMIERLDRESGGRPLICTEYMAREHGTTFAHSLPIFRKRGISCYNWGLVAGKSQTHFSWKTQPELEGNRQRGEFIRPGDPIPEPDTWFHDIFRVDGTPYDPEEVEVIRREVGR